MIDNEDEYLVFHPDLILFASFCDFLTKSLAVFMQHCINCINCIFCAVTMTTHTVEQIYAVYVVYAVLREDPYNFIFRKQLSLIGFKICEALPNTKVFSLSHILKT